MLIKRKKLVSKKKKDAQQNISQSELSTHQLNASATHPSKSGSHTPRALPEEVNLSLIEAEKQIQQAKRDAHKIRQEAEAALASAENKLKEAELSAKSIITIANSDAEKIKKETYEYTIQQANKQLEPIKDELKSLFGKLFSIKKEALEQVHGEIINVALDLTEKIIKHKASIDPEFLKGQVIEAIKKATTDAERVQVYVNPIDEEKLARFKNEIEKLFPIGTDIMVHSDESIDIGSCVIETKSGKLDAKFSTQLEALKNLVSTLELPLPEININEANKAYEEIPLLESIPEAMIEEPPKEEVVEKETSAASLFGSFMENKKIEPLEYEIVDVSPEEFEQQQNPSSLETLINDINKKEEIESNTESLNPSTEVDESNYEINDIEESSLFAVDEPESDLIVEEFKSSPSLYDPNDEIESFDNPELRARDLEESSGSTHNTELPIFEEATIKEFVTNDNSAIDEEDIEISELESEIEKQITEATIDQASEITADKLQITETESQLENSTIEYEEDIENESFELEYEDDDEPENNEENNETFNNNSLRPKKTN